MSRTPINPKLIHNPEEVKSVARQFDVEEQKRRERWLKEFKEECLKSYNFEASPDDEANLNYMENGYSSKEAAYEEVTAGY